MKALFDVYTERLRQIEKEGWTAEHDNSHGSGELAAAGAAYAAIAEDLQGDRRLLDAGPPAFWPFEGSWWKPSPEPRRNLVKATALLLAEIERLDRAEETTHKASTPYDECWSLDGEYYRWTSLKELIDDTDGLIPGQTVYRAIPVHPDPAGYIYGSHDLIESMEEAAAEHLGEFAEDYPNPEPEALQLLDGFLKAWARKNCQPHFYGVKNDCEYVIQQSDLEA